MGGFSLMEGNFRGELSTKQKILTGAVNLFAVKGYTETSIRELADAVGLKGGSIYNHFQSKNAILQYILEDYSSLNTSTFDEEEIRAKLREDSTVDGIMKCFKLTFPKGKEEYYLKVLCVMLQEQHRNPVIHDFVSSQIILHSEYDVRVIFQILKDLGVIRHDVDFDPWVKTISSLLYAFSSRMSLGIGDKSPGYSGMGLVEVIRFLIKQILATYGVEGK
jgi:AcrR family transcriptional regulator